MATSYMAIFEGYSRFSNLAVAPATGYMRFLKVYGKNLTGRGHGYKLHGIFLRVILDFQTLETLKSLERVE